MTKNTPKRKVPRNERLDNLKPPYDGMNDNTRKKLTDNTLDKTKKIKLAPFHGVEEVEISILSEILYRLRPRLFHRDETPKQRVEAVEKAKEEILKYFSSLIADRENKMLEFVIPDKKPSMKSGEPTKDSIDLDKMIWSKKRGYNEAIDDARQRAKQWQESEGGE